MYMLDGQDQIKLLKEIIPLMKHLYDHLSEQKYLFFKKVNSF